MDASGGQVQVLLCCVHSPSQPVLNSQAALLPVRAAYAPFANGPPQSPHPLPLPTSDHLLRCFVHRTPCTSPGMSPRLSRLWRFALYLGSDHKSLMRFRSGPGSGSGAGGLTGGLGLSGGGTSASSPQLLMIAQQTGRWVRLVSSWDIVAGFCSSCG